MQRLTLAQQIAQLEDAAPTDFDPEDIYGETGKENVCADNDGDVDMEIANPAVGREHYTEVGPSELRKLRDSIADPKYNGVKTSRKVLEDEVDAKGEEEEGSEGGSEKEGSEVPSRDGRGDLETPASGAASDSASEAEDDRDYSSILNGVHYSNRRRKESSPDREDNARHQDQTLAASLRNSRVADKLKGKAVSRQLVIWDSLVDARIRLQKSVAAANRLPHPDNIGPYVSSPAGRIMAQGFLSEALRLSEELFELRRKFLAERGVSVPPRKRRKIDIDIEPDYEALVVESTAEMAALDVQTHPDTLTTLQKWSSKVQAVAPTALLSSSRVSFKTGPAHVKSAAELVEETLRDKSKAVKRTWGKGDGARVGERKEPGMADEGDGDEEAFDDREFYHAMLRDVIESKGGGDGVNAADLHANSQRQKKKRAIDTKASKGRKLRYEPHEKLQHFMVPVPVRGAWHEEQIDELFASLLGRGFEDPNADGVEGGATEKIGSGGNESVALQGFRVFG